MSGALILSDQATGAGLGTAGVARNDLWLDQEVVYSCAEPGNTTFLWEIVEPVPGSSAVLGTPTAATATLTPDVVGTWRIRLTVDGGGPGNVQILVFRVRYDDAGVLTQRGWAYPAKGETDEESNYDGNDRGYAEVWEYIFEDMRTAVLSALTPLTNSAPANVTAAAAVVGVANESARADHKHNITTAAAGAIAIGDASSVGASSALARADHGHALAAPAAPVNVTKAAASAGVDGAPARADHKHDIATAAAGAIAIGDAASEGSSTSLARADHGHAVTAAAPTQGIGGGNSEGAAPTFSRSDHGHAIRTTTGPTDLTVGAVIDGEFLKRVGATIVSAVVPSPSAAAPIAGIGGGNIAGSGPTFSYSDHNHTLRTTTGPTDLTIGAIVDGEFLKRVGSEIVSATAGGGGGGGNIVARTTVTNAMSPYTVLAGDHWLLVNTTAGPVTLTLPAHGTTDREYVVKDIAGTFGTNACTLARNGGTGTIEGLASNYLLEAPFQAMRLASDAVSAWWLL